MGFSVSVLVPSVFCVLVAGARAAAVALARSVAHDASASECVSGLVSEAEKVRRDREIDVVLSEHRQWRQHSVGTDRCAALRLHIGGELHQEWMVTW